MAILSSDVQNRWKDCYASSAQIKLTLRSNGEEKPKIITATREMVLAGITEPTVIPTCAAGTAGSLTNGNFVAYRYVYASSLYPFVENAVTGGGQLYPRSNPSTASAVFTVTASGAVVVTITKTTAAGIDKIWIYRTAQKTTSADASALAAAGEMFYVGQTGNDGLSGTTTFQDTVAVETATEQLELDNYVAPTFQLCVFDGDYFWGVGNFEFTASVTLNGTNTVTLATGGDKWYDGRNGQTVKLDGISFGGFDSRGTFYFKWITATTAQLCFDPLLTIPLAVLASGTTKIHIRGPSTALYRSKIRNPFSWGVTEIITVSGSTIRVPQLFVQKVGGGTATAIAVIADRRTLKIDCEEPARAVTFDLNQADSDTFGASQSTNAGFSIGSHFSQFPAVFGDQITLAGLDAKTYAIVATDGETQQPISDPVFRTLRALINDTYEQRFFHGVHDPRTELNCWWVKTLSYSGDETQLHGDMLIWNHAPSGMWGRMRDFEVSASASIYDPVTNDVYTMIGTESGHVGKAFDATTFANWTGSGLASHTATLFNVFNMAISTLADAGGSLNGKCFIANDNLGTVGVWFDIGTSGVAIPAAAAACTRAVKVDQNGDGPLPLNASAALIASGLTFAFQSDLKLLVLQGIESNKVHLIPKISGGSAGSAADSSTGFTFVGFSYYAKFPVLVSFVNPTSGVWALITNTPTHATLPLKPRAWVRMDGLCLGGPTTDYFVPINLWFPIATLPSVIGGTPGFTTTGTFSIFIGLIECRARRYFDLTAPTKNKKIVEMWTTMQNVDPVYSAASGAFYKEYDTSEVTRFQLVRDKRPGSTAADSVSWLTKTKVPTTLLNEFGLEFAESGFLQWKLQTITLKYNAAS